MEYYIILIIKKLLRPPNTDNKGNLFVTVFATAPAFKRTKGKGINQRAATAVNKITIPG
jgi:hypothetical protein